jgi:CheY-like chemotaxis protein
MPIVDGLTSTKMIRSYETRPDSENFHISTKRIPILAVSASLLERERQVYINAGFDGWILKPIDFKRLSTLLIGTVDEEVRKECLYQPGEWERGGFFELRHSSAHKVDTLLLDVSPVTKPSTGQAEGGQADDDSTSSAGMSATSSEQTLKDDLRRPLIHDERLDATESSS